MSLQQIVKTGVEVATMTMRAWLHDEGVTLSEELVLELESIMRGILYRGPGVTHAERLVVDDQRTKET